MKNNWHTIWKHTLSLGILGFLALALAQETPSSALPLLPVGGGSGLGGGSEVPVFPPSSTPDPVADPVTPDPAPDPVSSPIPDPVAPIPEPSPTATEDTRSSISLERKDDKTGNVKTIRLVKTGSIDDPSNFFVICNVDSSNDNAPQRIVIHDTSSGMVEVTIDQNKVIAPLADVLKKAGGDGHIEMSAGKAYLGENDLCATTSPKAQAGSLRVEQGKTKLTGSYLVYDETDGLAQIKGPITFSRVQENDNLNGSSESLVMDVDKSITKLVGKVKLQSKDRTSEANEVVYNDSKNTAILRGTPTEPAKTTQGKDTLQAEVIIYNLETNEVRVYDPRNRIVGAFDDGQ